MNALLKTGAKAYISMPINLMKSQGLRPSKKLAHQRIGPCKVIRRLGTYLLTLVISLMFYL